MIKHYIAISMIAFVASGCLVGPKYSSPAMELPSDYAHQSDSLKQDSISSLNWWQLFQNDDLQSLIKIALEQNKDLRTSLAKIDEARATLGMSKADLYPALGYSIGANAYHLPGDLSSLNGGAYNTMASLNWEIDLWGKIRHSNKAAYAAMMSDVETTNSVSISVISGIAELFVQLRSLDSRLDITNKTIEARKENFSIINDRYLGGNVAEIDMQQAKAQLASVEALKPQIEREIIRTENAIRVMLGQNPGAIVRSGGFSDQMTRFEIPAGLPSELLQRRPDIKSAEQGLIAQSSKIGVAQAMRFPSLNLAGMIGALGSDITMFTGDGLAMTAGATFAGPIFNFGKNKNRVRIEEAKYDQAKYQYEKTVLQAFSEVASSLNSIQSYKEQVDATRKEMLANQKILEFSQMRYDSGFVTYLEVINSESNLLSSQIDLINAEQAQVVETIKLYKALGGGW